MYKILRTNLYLLFAFSTYHGYAQFQASNWVVSDRRKVITIQPGVFSIDTLKWGVSGRITTSSISTASGDLLAFSTGIDVRDKEGNYIENGMLLCAPGTPSHCSSNCTGGTPFFQGSIFLPKPGSNSQYYLFIKDKGVTANCQPSRVTATLVDMTYNNGHGKVLNKMISILEDTLSDSRMTACKHANGRDWWLINHEYNTNRIYTHLLTPDSIYGPYSQWIGGIGKEPDFSGWSTFSPDGKSFATETAGMSNYKTGTGISLLDFDRCGGVFSNYRIIRLDTTMTLAFYSSFLAFSPNGRFLYSGSNNYLYQYDLDATDISASGAQLIYDSMPPYLGMMSLMPDGKIYLPGWSGSNTGLDSCFSVVNQPDLKAPACDFQLRSVCVPGATQIIAAPNHPNYNLGALIGSGCDTIQTTIEEVHDGAFTLYPNPVAGTVHFTFEGMLLGKQLKVYNIEGALVKQFEITVPDQSMDVSQLSNGLYVVEVEGMLVRKKLRMQNNN